MTLQALLLDLDGTLADTAQDLLNALNAALIQHHLASISIMPQALLSEGFGSMLEMHLGHPPSHQLIQTAFENYLKAICVHTQLYPGMIHVLEHCEQHGLPWGIVTNKPERFTIPLLQRLKLDQRASVVVCGDTLATSKPSPEPLQHAARKLDLPCKNVCFVGDSLIDVRAGEAAGMQLGIAGYGYVPRDQNLKSWGGHCVFSSPKQLLSWLQSSTPPKGTATNSTHKIS